MTEKPRAGDTATPRRFRTLRFNPLRDILPWVAVVVGVVLTVRGAIAVGATGDTTFVIAGPVLVVIGVAVFFINRWQARRGT